MIKNLLKLVLLSIASMLFFKAKALDGRGNPAVKKAASFSGPIISYSSPKTFTVGTPVTPLSPSSSGVYSPGYMGSPVIKGTGFNSPFFLARGADGIIYIADSQNNAIKKILPDGGVPLTLASGFNTPYGLALNAAGDIYVADLGSGTIKKISAGSNTPVNISATFNQPTDVAVDQSGNLYVVSYGDHSVKKVTFGITTTVSVVSNAFSGPTGIALDAAGNIYVTDIGSKLVTKMPAGGGTPVAIGSGFIQPAGITIDATGNVYVTDQMADLVRKIPADGTATVNLSSAFSYPTGIVVDPIGNLYVSDGNNNVSLLAPTGGYYISPALPAGLTFNSNTGVISGTPAVATPATNYKITAYNPNGGTSVFVNIKTVLPAPPVISYNSPQNYVTGTAITPVTPVASGTAAPGYNPAGQAIASGFSNPIHITLDAAGNVYVANSNNNLVQKVPAGGGTPVTIGNGFVNPAGVAVDAAGNIYVADFGNNAIKKIPANGGPITPIGSGFSHPADVAVDAAGNVYVADYDDGLIKKIPAGGGTTVTLSIGYVNPIGIALDAGGNIYVTDATTHLVTKLPPAGGTPVTIGSGITSPNDVAVDNGGNVYVADFSANNIKKIPADGGATTIAIALNYSPDGIAIDPTGNLYVSTADNVLSVFTPVGGYFISQPLPAGLSFNSTTGVISGTPTAVSPATDYLVSAYNAGGGTSFSINIEVRASAAATLSYAGPKTYPINTAITSLAPTSSGVAAASYSATPVVIASGFNAPRGLAVDAAGNVFAADEGNHVIREIPAGGAAPFIVASGFTKPCAVAFDAAGNMYVVDFSGTAITKIPAGGGTPVTLGSGFVNPTGLALDKAGNIYVADYGNNAVKRIPFDNSTAPVTIGSGFSLPRGVCLDAAGNVYVADYGHGLVKKIPADGSLIVDIGSGFNSPSSVRVDASGNLFIADYGGNAVKEIPAGTNSVITIGSGYHNPVDAVVGPSGAVFVSDDLNNVIKQINPVGGYYISAPLPSGLSFSNATGVISGTPTAISPATNYTVTAYNAGGGTTANVNITVPPSTNAKLATIKVNPVTTLTTVTGPGYVNYTTHVPFSESSLTVTATAADAGATIKINGTATASGVASQPLPLTVGDNVINIVVTAQDGTTTKTYIITATRAAGASIATLSNLTLSAGTLSPVFASATTGYTATVTNATASIAVTPTATDAGATIQVNGTAVASGTASAAIALNVGANAITTVVTAQDGTTTKTYTLTVTRAGAGSSNAALTSIKLTPKTTLTTVAGPGYANYTTPVPFSESSLTITPTAQDANATIKINGTAVASGVVSQPIPLTVGDNVINIVVTAQDGTTTKAYIITATRAAGVSITTLSNLALSAGTLNPVFASATTGYTATVANATASIKVTPTATDAGATIKVNGITVASGAASGNITLAEGSNTITMLVTAQDGTTTKTYTVTVTRAAAGLSTNALLTSVKITPATGLTTVSGPGYANYTTAVPNSETSLTVTATHQDANATIKVNGTTVASGAASSAIPLNVGDNVITTVVTAQDGATTKTYIITATRAASDMFAKYEDAPADNLKADGITVHQGVSPNGDGDNDVLSIDGITNYPDNKLQIMNRSGDLVYEATGYDNTTKVFDGRASTNGKLQPAGTYFYSLEYKNGTETKHKTGFIVLKY